MVFFFFTCGEHTFTSRLKGYEDVTVQCMNCGNVSAHVFKRWQWFTLCFVPIIPFSFKPYHEVGCHICRFFQDIKYRPDVEANHGQIPMNGYGAQHPAGAAAAAAPPEQHQYK
ncbi:hypothetical protein EJ05DRAFT_364148 [Pseudovirgaria hyperparasitica]|uniref:Zinc-ribbon 15 domain-containing protein n=1 Tax=Pseudovirgaria hyperparasitica TaxID=470096 RepID=A0A6A6W7F4_9PEZI|nr:uncharacterized protein EJ05DRAFT_364148 [Pseudovirgaria hyperparasitica]KAF2758792.1 hypothetical protein EJ05DRAFT_364148 [Pseudovirgaria hyperparasitica]